MICPLDMLLKMCPFQNEQISIAYQGFSTRSGYIRIVLLHRIMTNGVFYILACFICLISMFSSFWHILYNSTNSSTITYCSTQNFYTHSSTEKSINNLVQLEEAIKTNGFQLFVEKYSSSYSLLEVSHFL